MLQPATPGTDLVTTIDRSVQYQAEQVLVRQVGVTGAVGGQIIVMDTDTGDVIAMVSVDRNEQGVPVVSGGNFAAVGAYEPGSVGKVITLAGALEEGAVTPDTMFGYVPWEYDCTIDVGGVLHDSHPARSVVADHRRRSSSSRRTSARSWSARRSATSASTTTCGRSASASAPPSTSRTSRQASSSRGTTGPARSAARSPTARACRRRRSSWPAPST